MVQSETMRQVSSLLILVVISSCILFGLKPSLAAGGLGSADFLFYSQPPVANDLKMVSVDGAVFKLSDFKGNVVLLNFWRKDCPYCVQEKYYLRKMLKQIDRPDLKVVCVDFWDNPSWVKGYGQKSGGELVFGAKPDSGRSVIENFVRGRHMGYFVLNEANEAVYEVKGFPSTYVIDKEGRVVASHMGMVDWSTLPVQKLIAGFLGKMESEDTVSDSQYELPVWLERLLTNTARGGLGHFRVDFRRADVGPAR